MTGTGIVAVGLGWVVVGKGIVMEMSGGGVVGHWVLGTTGVLTHRICYCGIGMIGAVVVRTVTMMAIDPGQ